MLVFFFFFFFSLLFCVQEGEGGWQTRKICALYLWFCSCVLLLTCPLPLGDETNDGGKKCASARQNERNISSLLENLADGDVDMDAVLG